ncbi:MAG: hypothetical protein IKM08_07425, partial [Clostridia bacterium]|nr:hypothetical protein [Clostridia bacterium]
MKRFLALLLMLCLLLPLMTSFPVSAATAAPILPITLTLGFPAVKADTSETVDLSFYSVTADDGSVLAADQIVWTSDEITVTGGKVTPATKGVYRLTATAGGKSKTVYLLVKDPADTEYVLFDEDFEDVSSFEQLQAEGYTVAFQAASAAISVTNGKLVLSGQAHNDCYIRLLFPEWLGDFGDYRIEINAAMTARIANTHWMAFMYRVQNDDIPYYQNTFRAVTTAYNGTEVAERKADNTWDVMAEFTNIYNSEGSVQVSLSVVKDVEDEAETGIDKSGFAFELYDADEDFNTENEPRATVVTNAEGVAAFRDTVFTEEGTYFFVLKEAEGDNSCMEYDAAVYYCTVEITSDPETSGLVATGIVENDDGEVVFEEEVSYDPETQTVPVLAYQASFVNVYEPYGTETAISGTKVLNGRDLNDGEFTFELYEADLTDNG